MYLRGCCATLAAVATLAGSAAPAYAMENTSAGGGAATAVASAHHSGAPGEWLAVASATGVFLVAGAYLASSDRRSRTRRVRHGVGAPSGS